MLMSKFLKNRKSTREFRKKKVNKEILINIDSILGQVGNEKIEDKIKYNFYENGQEIYEKLKGISGYSGTMIESPYYIGMERFDDNKSTLLYGAYYMEKIITELNELGLDTCWVSLGDLAGELKKEIFDKLEGEIDYLLAFGYSRLKNPFVSESSSARLGVEEIVYNEEIGKEIDMTELENRGLEDLFYYVRFAPSKQNLQPWRFILGKDTVTLLIKDEGCKDSNYIDAGIIMYYFSELGRSIGINEEWKLLDKVYQDEDGKYEYIGEINL